MSDNRGRIQYPDIVLAFATLVTFIAVSPWVNGAIGMAEGTLPPLSSILLRLTLAIFVIGLIVSVGVSARTS